MALVQQQSCNDCGEANPATASRCGFCGRELTADTEPDEIGRADHPAFDDLLADSRTTATDTDLGAEAALHRLLSAADKGWGALQGRLAAPGAAAGAAATTAATSVTHAATRAATTATTAATQAAGAVQAAWTASPAVALLLCVASVALLLVLQIGSGPLLSFWPFLLVAPILVALLRGPLWGCLAALLVAASQALLPWLPGSEAAVAAATLPATGTDWPRLGACLGTGVLAAIGTHSLRQSHTTRRDEAQVFRAQLRLAAVTSDPSSLPVLLNAAVREVAELTGRAVCGLFLWDAARGAFALAQQSPPPASRENSVALPADLSLSPAHFPALQRAMETRAPQVVERAELAASPEIAGALFFPAVALIPLVNWGRVSGCFLLAGDLRARRGRRERWKPAPFSDTEIEVASGFAGQVAVAVENARLYDEILAQKELIAVERQKSERLLLNVLPAPIAERLKQSPQVIADSFAEVTVVFADIVDFTPLSAALPPQPLVRLLNAVFSAFDALAEQHGLEKIKTIGDAYMVVAGLPEPRADHAQAAARMALAMQQEVVRFQDAHGAPLRLRVGMHTGPVVAGVIGARKFAYDLWGDTVNTASRMESQGLPGGIQVTQATYERLHDQYAFEDRGTITVKGKGEMPVYLLRGEHAQEPTGKLSC